MDDNTIEALREVLQDMAKTIELLSTGARSGQALIAFLEEVLKTIEAWAAKYNVTLDGKTNNLGPTEDYPDSDYDSDSSCSVPSPSPATRAMVDQNNHHLQHPYAPANSYHFPDLHSEHNDSQMMDQLELALDLDQDVHVNVNELMDLAHPRMHSAQSLNGDSDTMPSSDEQGRLGFPWQVPNDNKHMQDRQCLSQMEHHGLSFQMDRGCNQSGQLSHLHMSRLLNGVVGDHQSGLHTVGDHQSGLHTVGDHQSGLHTVAGLHDNVAHGNPHIDGDPMCMGMVPSDESHLKLISPNHASKCLKLDIATPFTNQMVVSQTYEGGCDLMKSSEWLDKVNGNQHYR